MHPLANPLPEYREREAQSSALRWPHVHQLDQQPPFSRAIELHEVDLLSARRMQSMPKRRENSTTFSQSEGDAHDETPFDPVLDRCGCRDAVAQFPGRGFGAGRAAGQICILRRTDEADG